MVFKLFAILQKYDFSSKSQLDGGSLRTTCGCLRYCKSTIFQANHNAMERLRVDVVVVCDTAKVRFFKQITTKGTQEEYNYRLFAILQKYDFSSKSQQRLLAYSYSSVVCDTAKVRFFKQITTRLVIKDDKGMLFAILQKYDFSSKSQQAEGDTLVAASCLRYCKSTIFQANHNRVSKMPKHILVVCDTAKVRFFKQITTGVETRDILLVLFAILQKYDFSSKSQLSLHQKSETKSCLRYCKSTIFQANHNENFKGIKNGNVVCDTAKVRFFKQITTRKSPQYRYMCCLRYCKSTIFQANHNLVVNRNAQRLLFAILQKYDFSSKSQLSGDNVLRKVCCLRYCKSTIFQANHN